MATAPANAEKMLLDRSDGSATIDLYRAALGPVRTDYYLKAFTRFDAVGHSGPGWNWTAALLSLNWMLFRQLWSAALAYLGAVTGAALLLLGIVRLLFQWPAEVQWALLGLLVLLAIALPGAYGNAWLYAACNKKMERALRESATMEDACSQLARHAAGRQRVGFFLAGNLALCAAVVALVMAWPDSSALPLNTHKMDQAREVPVELGQSGLAAHGLAAVSAAPAASAASAAAADPAAPAVSAVASSATPPSRSSQGLVQVAALAAPAALAAVPASAATAQPLPPASAPATAIAPATAVAAKPLPHAMPAQKLAVNGKKPPSAKLSAKAAKKAAALEKKEKAAKTRQVAALDTGRSAQSKSPASKSAAAATTPEEKFLINVGLFAEANNALNAYTKLQDAGLPALSQEIKSSKGPLTRVRVGPFETQAEADAAAEKIRALKLEAAVFKQ